MTRRGGWAGVITNHPHLECVAVSGESDHSNDGQSESDRHFPHPNVAI